LLNALFRLSSPGKKEVVIPAYTCFSVAASIARVGLRIRLIDIDPLTMDYDYNSLQNIDRHKVLAVIACNLFGIINDWERLWHIGDDAAQSLGSVFNNCPSGTLGDVGFYSLDRGKGLSTYAGGVLITNRKELADHIDRIVKSLPQPGLIMEGITLIKLLLYGLFLHPHLYWIPNMLPFLGLGETKYDEKFPIARLTRLQYCAGSVMFEKLAQLHSIRSANSRKLAEEIFPLDRFQIPGYNAANCPVYLRLPVLAPDRVARDRAVSALRQIGVVTSNMYPSTIREIPAIDRHLALPKDHFPGARQVVEQLFTLPTHPYVRDNDIKKIVSCLRRI